MTTTYTPEEKEVLEEYQDKEVQVEAINIQFHSGYKDKGYAGKRYTYKSTIKDVHVGDLVVVQTSGQYKVVRVTDVNVPITMPDDWYRWVLMKFIL
ncbi:hypothetical protein LCGC14_2341650 [marine sediment metagenome]|uniref:Uncharacterized protein n=1 Tax=marine sediment metagenome TaxID=412755 RepID=A0A0F9CBS7_9ZZZZ